MKQFNIFIFVFKTLERPGSNTVEDAYMATVCPDYFDAI